MISRHLTLAGIVGPIWFLAVLITLGFNYPGYSHISDVISLLGAVGAPNALLMNVIGFVAFGFNTF